MTVSHFDPLPPDHRISDLMRRLMTEVAPGETITVGRILYIFGVRGFAFLLLVLALLNIVIFMVPFLSFFFGLPMVILSVQMVLGLRTPVFPRVIRRREVSQAALAQGVTRAVRGLELVERFIKPRLTFLSDPSMMRFHGVFALVLSVMVMLPIPVVNVPPSIALALLSIGILSRDGVFIILGYMGSVWCLWLFKSLGHIAHLVTQ